MLHLNLESRIQIQIDSNPTELSEQEGADLPGELEGRLRRGRTGSLVSTPGSLE